MYLKQDELFLSSVCPMKYLEFLARELSKLLEDLSQKDENLEL